MKQLVMTLLGIMLINAMTQGQNQDSLARSHKAKMDLLMTRPSKPVKTIGIYLYDGFQTLDAMGPYETLAEMGGGIKVFFVAQKKGWIKNQRGLKIAVDTSIAEVNQLDILVIPGGAMETFLQTQDSSVLNWIRRIDEHSIYTTSVCTGAWILGATGLLRDKKATTNWYRADEMLARYGATFQNRRWVQDGKYWTSAGVTAGLDMSLAIIKDLMGEQFAQGIMLNLEYDPHPPVQGGSPNKTPLLVTEMMREMYDLGILPLLNKTKK
ncbi:MAG: DJ-1/PfpI family protein [Bacteroidota bacterium]|nr:DJ-1/PfpI family protein [Bacteroidota bacterium]